MPTTVSVRWSRDRDPRHLASFEAAPRTVCRTVPPVHGGACWSSIVSPTDSPKMSLGALGEDDLAGLLPPSTGSHGDRIDRGVRARPPGHGRRGEHDAGAFASCGPVQEADLGDRPRTRAPGDPGASWSSRPAGRTSDARRNRPRDARRSPARRRCRTAPGTRRARRVRPSPRRLQGTGRSR